MRNWESLDRDWLSKSNLMEQGASVTDLLYFAFILTRSVDLFLSTGQQTLDLMMVRGRQDLKIQGPRLNQTKEDKMMVRHGADQRLNPIITPPMPLMEVPLTHCL